MSEKNKNTVKIQHYVPQFILRNFCVGGKKQLFAFDKKEEKSFKTNIKNIASENGFYDFEIEGKELSLEYPLSNLESNVSKIIHKIVSNEKLSVISDSEKRNLSFFLSVQKLRGTASRNMLTQMNNLIEKKLLAMNADLSKVKGFHKMKSDEVKRMSISMLVEANEYAPHYYNKAWFLYRSKPSNPFLISDNPVVLQNLNNFGPYGNLGLAVKGIEIYFPISNTLTLAILCKSNEEMFREVHEKYHQLKKVIPDIVKVLKASPDYYDRLIDSLDKGIPFDISYDPYLNLNSLQVIFSSRYIYSSQNDFSFVEKMLKDDPSFKEPIQIDVN